MATLLGGVFGSRLNVRLREELGYTYGAHASFDPRRSAGPLIARAAVETDVTAASIRELLAQLDRMRDEAPTDDELREVKNFMIGVFPLRFESTGGVAAAIEPLAVYGLPDDFWQRYRDRLEAVMPADVQRVARELIDPNALVILLTGDAAAVRASVEAEDRALEVVPAPGLRRRQSVAALPSPGRRGRPAQREDRLRTPLLELDRPALGVHRGADQVEAESEAAARGHAVAEELLSHLVVDARPAVDDAEHDRVADGGLDRDRQAGR